MTSDDEGVVMRSLFPDIESRNQWLIIHYLSGMLLAVP
jgi:hypothetical protein